jgi:hypothetical protein
MIPNYSTREAYDRLFALGVTLYGQMTAGSYCYIGPQGIVHGTTVRHKMNYVWAACGFFTTGNPKHFPRVLKFQKSKPLIFCCCFRLWS